MNRERLRRVLETAGTILLLSSVVVAVAARKGGKREVAIITSPTQEELSGRETAVDEEPVETFHDLYTEEEIDRFLSRVTLPNDFITYVIGSNSNDILQEDQYYWQKVYLSMHPEISIEGFGNPYADDAHDVAADGSGGLNTEPLTQGVYDNREVTFEYEEGRVISVGEDNPPNGDGIYISLSCSHASTTQRVGFYLTSRAGMLQINYSPGSDVDVDSGANVGQTNFLITGRTYDHVVPAECRSATGNGAVWRDRMAYLGERTNSDTLFCRAICLDSGNLLSMFRIEIVYSGGHYRVTDVYPCDVFQTGELTATERSELVEQSIEYLDSKEEGPFVAVTDKDAARASAKVEYVPSTYFWTLYDTEQRPMRSTEIGKNVDIYAVNLNLPGMGVVTVYYGPANQLLYHFAKATNPGSLDKKLMMLGFDAFRPFSADSIPAVDEFIP